MILLPFSLDGYSAGYGLRIVIIFKKERGSNEIGNRSKEVVRRCKAENAYGF